MSEEPELEDSPLSGPLTSGSRKVEVQIYRLKGDQARNNRGQTTFSC